MNRYHELALHGLLHDIGKFWQRAEGDANQPLGPGFEGFSPEEYGKNGAHATWSAAFVTRYVPKAFSIDYSPVLYHHKPHTHHANARRLALADRLAAGERADAESQQPSQTLSIFNQINGQSTSNSYLSLLPLEPSHLFGDTARSEKERRADYQALWEDFSREAKELEQITDGTTLITSLYYLMERYTWSVPAAYYRSVPDISLFDHSRVTAAVVACLADFDDMRISHLLQSLDESLDGRHPDGELTVAYLVEGDISGVQQFIYTISSRGATPMLRGRSFYLQLLTDAVARYILRWFGLPITNLIYAGGGHFYLLLPPAAFADLEKCKVELDDIFFKYHGGELYIGIGAAPLTCQDFQLNSFAAKWSETVRAVSRDKRQRFGPLGETLFNPQGHGGNEEQECQVCHYEGPDVGLRGREFDEDENKIRQCALCASLRELGDDLRDAEQLLWVEIEPQHGQAREEWQQVLAALGIGVMLYSKDKWRGWLAGDGLRGVVQGLTAFPTLDEVDELEKQTGFPLARSRRFTVNVTPYKREKGDKKRADFSDLQKSATGIKRLGVLRMDVDSLGAVFRDGFKTDSTNYATLARVASLSSALGRFFEGYVGILCRKINEDRWNAKEDEVIYSIYSGGDDLFIVGAWNYLLDLAQEIHREFYRYSLGRLTVSAGITLHSGKQPLYQAAESAHHALEKAKELPGKDGISFLGHACKWDDFATISDWQRHLKELVGKLDNRAPLGIIHNLYDQQQAMIRQLREHGGGYLDGGQPQRVVGPFIWRGIYQLARLKERSRHNVSDLIEALMDKLQNDPFDLENLSLAARWAEALTRQEK